MNFRTIVRSWYFPWLLVGIVLRILLSMFTAHPDIWGISLVPTFLSYGVINPYDFLSHLSSTPIPYAQAIAHNSNPAEIFIYPPLAYYVLGAFAFLLRPFYDSNYFYIVASQFDKTLGTPDLFRYLLLAKLPYLFFDLVSLYYFCKIFTDDIRKQRMAFFLWLFNPLVLYGSYMVGNLDILSICFTVIGLFFLSRKRYPLAFLLFGIGAAFKTYPILIALPLVFIYGETLRQRVHYFLHLVMPYIVTSLPFIMTPLFRTHVLFSDKNTKFLYMGLPVSGAEFIYVFILLLGLIVFVAHYRRAEQVPVYVYPLTVLLALFSVTHYHPQWMAWLSPFVLMLFIDKSWSRWPIGILLACYIGIVLFFEPSLNIGIFGPIFPQSVHLKGLTDMIGPRFDVFELKSLLRSGFAATAAWIVIRMIILSSKETTEINPISRLN